MQSLRTRVYIFIGAYLTVFVNGHDNEQRPFYCYDSHIHRFDVLWKCNETSHLCQRIVLDENLQPTSNDCLTSLPVCKLSCDWDASLWPKPSSITRENKSLVSVDVENVNFVTPKNAASARNTKWTELQSYLSNVTRRNFKNKIIAANGAELKITIRVVDDDTMYFVTKAAENYTMSINRDSNAISVVIESENYFGARHAIETLVQLIVYDELSKCVAMPSRLSVHDSPVYTHRGILLDTARSFYSVDSIKRLLDGMAMNKLNTFHWHLTDSQSFPYLSSNYPKMSAYGTYSASQVYTKSDIRALVEYAKIRGIRIIPELDAPAHVGEGWQIFNDARSSVVLCLKAEPWRKYCVEPPCGVLNPLNPKTYSVLEKLYDEFEQIFESDLIHMGGDEVSFVCWNNTDSITKWMTSKNLPLNEENFMKLWTEFQTEALARYDKSMNGTPKKKAILWTSTLTEKANLTQDLPTNRYIIQIWTSMSNAQTADLLFQGYDLIVSNYDGLYFDCGFGAWIGEANNNWCSPYIGWQKVYNNDPQIVAQKSCDMTMHECSSINELASKQILGAEAALWSEQSDDQTLDGRIWPRASALAERLWSDPKTDWKAAESRLLTHRNRLVSRGIAADLTQMSWCDQNQGLCY